MSSTDILTLVYQYLAVGFFLDLAVFTFGVWAWRTLRKGNTNG